MMNKIKLNKLISFLNDFIKSDKINKYSIAIPWVHFIRYHPERNKIYFDFFIKNSIFNRLKLFFKYNHKIVITILYQLYKIILNRKNIFWFGSKDESEVDVLFISHLINHDSFENEEDLYFGKIPSKLTEKKVKVAVAYINYTKSANKNFNKRFKEVSYKKYFFTDSLGLKLEFKIFKSIIQEFYRLKKIRKFYKKKSFENKVVNHISKQVMLNGTFTNLRLYRQIQILVKTTKPKNIITTFEGHAWERIAFLAARTQSPNIKCISYQHTGIFEHSNSLKIKLHNLYNPNLIYTSGLFSKLELDKQKEFSDIEIIEVGSTRGSISKSNLNLKKNKNFCLVIPEGFISECNYLFEFSLKCANLNPKITFIWRLHPSLSFDRILSGNKKYKTLPSNIEISKNNLDKDIMKCKWVLYRGSSAVFKAISYGLYPIYLRLNHEMSIDPLYKMSKFKIIVDSPNKFNEYILSKDDSSDARNIFYEDFCFKQFSNINIELIKQNLTISQ